MNIEREKEFKCLVCNKPFNQNDVLENDLKSIPHYANYPEGIQAICYNCTHKGYRFCSREDCLKPYNIEHSKHNNYYSLYDRSFSLNDIRYRDKSKYCCNECYNLDIIEEDIGELNMTVYEIEIEKLFPTDTGRLTKAKEQIISLNRIKDELIKQLK